MDLEPSVEEPDQNGDDEKRVGERVLLEQVANDLPEVGPDM
jgi:hypothetical protein